MTTEEKEAKFREMLIERNIDAIKLANILGVVSAILSIPFGVSFMASAIYLFTGNVIGGMAGMFASIGIVAFIWIFFSGVWNNARRIMGWK